MSQPAYAPHVEVYRIYLTGSMDAQTVAKYARHLINEGASPDEDCLEVWRDGKLIRIVLLGQIERRGVAWETPSNQEAA